MNTDPAQMQKLALRSDLPRLTKEGFHLFAQLEPSEQSQPIEERIQLLAKAYAAVIAYEEQRSERPLPAVLPRAYTYRETSEGWSELVFACDLAEPYERRNRAGAVLAVTKHLQGRVRVFQGAFAYFALDDVSPIESLNTAGFTALPA